MLKPIKGAPHLRNFLTYDMEWKKLPNRELKVRVISVYDGHRVRSYYTVADFLDGELTITNRAAWFFAHAGGLADVQFVVEALMHADGYTAWIATSGSSAIIVKIKKDKHTWCFCDSYWLLRDSLANIGKWIGHDKTGPPFDNMTQAQITHWYNTVAMSILQPYCENDAIVLWEAIFAFEVLLLEEGGELQRTIGSSAMRLFRRKYLQRPLETSDNANEKIRGAYFASRVEVLQKRGSGYYFDINSSFPWAMTQMLPGEMIQSYNHLPSHVSDGTNPYFVWAEITVPGMYLPPMPMRFDYKIYFPTGTWTTWISWIDVEQVLKVGGRINQVYECIEFEPWQDMAEYAHNIYARRRKASGFEKLGLKYLLNSLYGKLSEGEDKQVIWLRPPLHVIMRLDRDNMWMPGLWHESVTRAVPHAHVPAGAAITAYARRSLGESMQHGLDVEGELHYCDTDGFGTTIDDFELDDKLGGLKLEKVYEIGRFIQPKLYRLDGRFLKDGKWEKGTVVKGKGFSLHQKGKDPVKLFEQIANGFDIEVERMARLREQLKRKVIKPISIMIPKRMQRQTPKRCFNGVNSRPWDVRELAAKLAAIKSKK